MTRTKTRALANWPNNAVSVLDYGAVGDGNTDDTAAIQAAISDLNDTPGTNKTLYFPRGVYLYDGTTPAQITKGVSIIGASQDSVRITFTSTSNNFVEYSGTRGWEFSNLGFRAQQVCTSGNVIKISNPTATSMDALIDRIGYRGGGGAVNTMIYIDRGIQGIFMTNLTFKGSMQRGLVFNNATNSYLNTFIFDGPNTNDGSVGIELIADNSDAGGRNGCEVLDVVDGIIANFGIAIKAVGTTQNRFAGAIAGLKCSRVWFDDAKTAEAALLDNVLLSSFTECHFVSSEGQAGCWVKRCDDISFVGCHFDKNVKHGIRLDQESKNISIIGGTAIDNDDYSAGNYSSGVWIEGGTTDFVIDGLIAQGNTSIYNKPQWQGITVGTGCDDFVISNCKVNGNTGAGIQFQTGSMSASAIITNNVGYVSGNVGNFVGNTDASGQVTIAHGLATTPQYVMSSVRSAQAQTINAGVVTSTEITFTVFNPDGTPRASTACNFDWSAKL